MKSTKAVSSSNALSKGRPRANAQSMRVLVAEDDPMLREELAAAITELGHKCVTAKDGFEALALHKAHHFEVVLSDWMMPGMDGLELCRQMRIDNASVYTYFIFMTGLGDKDHVIQGLREGADEFMTKPLDLDEVAARLISAARITGLHRRLVKKNASLQRDSERAFKVARTDPLVEIGNRLSLSEDLAAMTVRARAGQRCCAAVCDVDFFKHFNDAFGHPAGDKVLQDVVGAMRASIRQGDTLYRYGGEEFVVILPDLSLAGAAVAMDRVRRTVEGLAVRHAPSAPADVVTISVGVAEGLHTGIPSQNEWLKRADMALYRAKANGRNRVELDVTIPRA